MLQDSIGVVVKPSHVPSKGTIGDNPSLHKKKVRLGKPSSTVDDPPVDTKSVDNMVFDEVNNIGTSNFSERYNFHSF